MIQKGTFFAFIDHYHWLWIALITPLLLFPSTFTILLSCIIPLLWINALFITKSNPLPVTPLNFSLLLFSLSLLVSLFATYNLAASLPKIYGVLTGIAIFFSLSRIGQNFVGWLSGWLFFVITGTGFGFISLFSAGWLAQKNPVLGPLVSNLPSFIQFFPGVSGGLHPNEIAGCLLWVLPSLLVSNFWLFYRHKNLANLWGKKKITLLTLFVCGSSLLCLIVFTISFSRTAYLGFLFAGCILFFFFSPPKGKLFLSVFFIVIVLILISLALFPSSSRVITSMINPGDTQTNPLSSLESRWELWWQSFQASQDFGFTGMGMNTFRTAVHILYPLTLVSPDFDIGHAHNEFLQITLDLGWIGLAAFLSLNMILFILLFKINRLCKTKQREDKISREMLTMLRVLSIGLGWGLLAHFIYGITDAVSIGARTGFLFWLLLSLISALYMLLKQNQISASENAILP